MPGASADTTDKQAGKTRVAAAAGAMPGGDATARSARGGWPAQEGRDRKEVRHSK